MLRGLISAKVLPTWIWIRKWPKCQLPSAGAWVYGPQGATYITFLCSRVWLPEYGTRSDTQKHLLWHNERASRALFVAPGCPVPGCASASTGLPPGRDLVDGEPCAVKYNGHDPPSEILRDWKRAQSAAICPAPAAGAQTLSTSPTTISPRWCQPLRMLEARFGNSVLEHKGVVGRLSTQLFICTG